MLRGLELLLRTVTIEPQGASGPSLDRVREEVAFCVSLVADWARLLRTDLITITSPYIAMVERALGTPGLQVLLSGLAAAMILGVLFGALTTLQRRRVLKASLSNVTLEVDPNTKWLVLAITIENVHSSPLLIRSIEIIEPSGAKISDYWQAWRPARNGANFIAPEMELTNSLVIERILRPYDLGGYAVTALPAPDSDRQIGSGPLDEFTRRFYVLTPNKRGVALRAKFQCELLSRRTRRLELTFRRQLPSPNANRNDPDASDLSQLRNS